MGKCNDEYHDTNDVYRTRGFQDDPRGEAWPRLTITGDIDLRGLKNLRGYDGRNDDGR